MIDGEPSTIYQVSNPCAANAAPGVLWQ